MELDFYIFGLKNGDATYLKRHVIGVNDVKWSTNIDFFFCKKRNP